VRFVVFGAGAIGGVVGAKLHQAGHSVVLVARGAHYRAVADHGLTLETPERTEVLDMEVTDDLATIDFTEPAVVLLGVKGQDTEDALRRLTVVAPATTPVVCMQNGVENERRVLRRFPATYAMCVMCPTTHLRPGVVQAHSSPVAGLLDLGRYPAGVDDTATMVAAALSGATFDSRALPDVMRWKYRKLVVNLGNAVGALCGTENRGGALWQAALREGEAVLAAAGIDVATEEEDRLRRGDDVRVLATESGPWLGGSSWQSTARGTGSIEADFLNGEIVLLARMVGLEAPVNALLQQMADRLAASGAPPGGEDPDLLLRQARA
jgi:2-dehydropantoate 2-reductase